MAPTCARPLAPPPPKTKPMDVPVSLRARRAKSECLCEGEGRVHVHVVIVIVSLVRSWRKTLVLLCERNSELMDKPATGRLQCTYWFRWRSGEERVRDHNLDKQIFKYSV